jgi:membrane associated rhomboid family serine protease
LFPLKDNIPTRRFPIVTVAIIVANVLVFFLFQKAKLSLGGAEIDQINTVEYGAIPYEITHPGDECGLPRDPVTGELLPTLACEGQGGVVGQAPDQPPTYLTVFTSMFMHGGLLHILGNMLFLWIFGNNVEDAMGRVKFILFYLAGGIAALLAQTLAGPNAAIPTIGASGAVAAVLGGYILLYPRARVVTLIFIIIFVTVIELPAMIVLGLWFLLQLFYGAAEFTQPVAGEGGVAYFAHIGGFIFGLVLIRLLAKDVRDDYERGDRIPVY